VRWDQRKREKKKLSLMADSWLGTTDSLSLTQLANEQINSQSRPCCLTSRPLPLQDNCLDCTLVCVSVCISGLTGQERPGRHANLRGPRVGRNRISHPSEAVGLLPHRRKEALIPFTQQKLPVSEKETPNICLFHAWDTKY